MVEGYKSTRLMDRKFKIMNKPNLEKDKKLLVEALRKLKSSKDLSAFVEDLFTEEETLDLAQRIKIAELILDGRTYGEIAEIVETSTSTVSKIGQVLKYGRVDCRKL